MSPKTYSIRRAWHDVLFYEDGEGRAIEFDCPSSIDPPQVSVPVPRRWAGAVPEWAHDQRSAILERLRKSGAVVYEADGDFATVLAPDETLRLELTRRKTAALWVFEQTMRVVALPQERIVADLPLHGVVSAIQFPAPGLATVDVQDPSGAHRRFRIDATGSCSVSPDGADRKPEPTPPSEPKPPAAAPRGGAPAGLAPATIPLRILAWIHTVLGGIGLLVGLILMVGLGSDPEEEVAFAYVTGFFLSIGVPFLLPAFVGGLGLMFRKRWARFVVIALSVLLLPMFPVGTALGAFGLWTLLRAGARAAFR